MYIPFIYGANKSRWPQDNALPSKDADQHNVWTMYEQWMNNVWTMYEHLHIPELIPIV